MQDVFAAMATALGNPVAEPPVADVPIPEAEEVTVEAVWCSHCGNEPVSEPGEICDDCDAYTVECECGCGRREPSGGNPTRRVYINDESYENWTIGCIGSKGRWTMFCEQPGCGNRMLREASREIDGCQICPACALRSGEYTQCSECETWRRTRSTRDGICYRCLGLKLNRDGTIDTTLAILLDVPPKPLPGLEGIAPPADPSKERDSNSKCDSYDLWKGGTILTLKDGEEISGKQFFPLVQDPPSGIVDGEYRTKVRAIVGKTISENCDWLDEEGGLIHADAIIDMLESHRVLTEDGRYHKRLQKCFQEFCKEINLKLTKDNLSDIGKIVSECKPRAEDNPNYLFMLYRDLNRPSSFYYNSGSCWWGGYYNSRCFVKGYGGIAMMLYKRSKTNPDRVETRGRSWLVPFAEGFKKAKSPEEVVSWVVANSYGDLDTEKTARELCRTLGKGWSYKHIDMRVMPSNGGSVYFNNGGRTQTFLVTKSAEDKKVKEGQKVEINWTKECRC